VAERVVDLLEVVDVEEQDGARARVLGLVGQLALELGLEAAAVVDAAEGIVIREMPELRLGLLARLDVEEL
jgi:hypothetical protein